MIKLYISVSENLQFSLWDRPEQCPKDEVMVTIELTQTQASKLGTAGIMARAKAEKDRKLEELKANG